jgi:hypothetical protein
MNKVQIGRAPRNICAATRNIKQIHKLINQLLALIN